VVASPASPAPTTLALRQVILMTSFFHSFDILLFFLESDFENPIQPTLLTPEGIDTVTLAAVLGSVAIICVTIVAVAIAIVFLKKQEARKKYVIFNC